MPNDIVNLSSHYGYQADWASSELTFWMSGEHFLIATVRYDRNFCRIYASPAYMQLIVNKGKGMLGKTIDDTWWPTNISAKAYRAALEDVMLTGRESEVTLEWTDEDGRLVSYIEKLVPEYDASGDIAGVSVLVIDVSALRHRQMIESKRLRVFERLAHGDNLDGILEQVVFYVESVKPGVYCSILVLDEAKQCLQTVAAPSLPDSYKVVQGWGVLANEPGCCDCWLSAASSGERVIVDGVGANTCSSPCQNATRELGIVACWFEPIFSSSGQLQGLLCLYLKRAEALGQDDSALLLQAAHLCSLSIERKRFEQQIYNQACYDPLTNLPNRRLFINRLREEIIKAERGDYGLAVLFIDLDRFKEVNDKLGHDAGDDLLIEAAQRIHGCVRESDTLARLGGDEFVIVLPEAGKSRLFERVAQHIVSTMKRPFVYGEHSIRVSASVGIALYPVDAINPESLISRADQAMYSAKDKGRSTYSNSSRRISKPES